MSEAELLAVFLLAGMEIKSKHQIVNQYWRIENTEMQSRYPWWLVETEFGLLRLGRRKRVIHMDWESTELRAIITTDDVTKEKTMVHAWGFGKLVQYLHGFPDFVYRQRRDMREAAALSGSENTTP